MQFPFQARAVTPIPPPGQMCEDCAFRPGSPERDPNYKGVSLAKVAILAESFLECGQRPPAFYCHAGSQPDGKGSYVEHDDMPVCQGWLNRYGSRIRAIEEEEDAVRAAERTKREAAA